MNTAEALFNSNVESAKALYENNLIESMLCQFTSKIFHYLRSITNTNHIPMEMQLNKTCVYSHHDKANLFNEYFKSIFTTESFILPDLDTIPCPFNYIDNIEFSEEEVF